MDTFPAFFPLSGRRIAIVGEGEAAEAKARLFDGSPAVLVRLDTQTGLDRRAYDGAALAFIAGAEPFCIAAAAVARSAGALVNVVDRPRLSDFQTPSIIDRGSVVGAIGTGGSAPMLASQLRNDIEARWPDGLGRVADLLRALQPEIRARLPDLDQRRAYLRDQLAGPAAAAALAGDVEKALALARKALTSPTEHKGRVWILEVPGSTDLVSLRALRKLGSADRIIADQTTPVELLALARRDAPRFDPQDAPPPTIAGWVEAGLEVVVIRNSRSYEDMDDLRLFGSAPVALLSAVAEGEEHSRE